MKKFLTLNLALVLLFTMVMPPIQLNARDLSFNVRLTSTPRARSISGGENTLKLKVGDTVTFRRTVTENGAKNTSWVWNWNRSHLSCKPTPDFDSPRMRCKVRRAGNSSFSITMYPEMTDGTTRTIESNQIYVTSTR